MVGSGGCGKEKPPAPKVASRGASPSQGAAPTHYQPDKDPAVLTYAGERGKFMDTEKLDEIPKEAKGLVRVNFLESDHRAAPGQVWVVNLQEASPEGFRLRAIPRKDFELAALGTGRRSQVKLPDGLELPKVVASEGVIIYKTVWCGVCTKVQQYLKQKGVKFVAKDIEKDPKAAAELRAKAKKAGVSTGSVPVIDVNGTLMVGFDKARLDRLLAKT